MDMSIFSRFPAFCRWAACILVVVAASHTRDAEAGLSVEHTLFGASVDRVAAHSRFDLVVARVTQTVDQGATHGNPPRVTLEILEVLRGDPKLDRREARWLAHPHDVDTGDIRTNPRYLTWAKTPLSGPPVGSTWILAGYSSADSVFGVASVGRFPLTDANRKLAIRGIEEAAEEDRKHAAQRAQEQNAWNEKMRLWREARTEGDLARALAMADFAVVGRVVSGPYDEVDPPRQMYQFELRETLKESPRFWTRDCSYASVEFPLAVGELLYPRDRDFVLFLSLEGATVRHHELVDAHPISLVDGLVEADASALAVVRAPAPSSGLAWIGWAVGLIAAASAGLILLLFRRKTALPHAV